MKKTLSLTLMTLLLCVCMVFGLTACGGFTQDDIDNAVNEAKAPLNEQIAALEADIAEKEAKIAALEGEKTALATEKTELLEDIEEIEAKLTALETEKTELLEDIEEIEAKLTALETEKATLKEEIAALEEEIASLTSRVGALESEKAELIRRINCLEGDHAWRTSYDWSDDYSDCTATQDCTRTTCDAENKLTATSITVSGTTLTATFDGVDSTTIDITTIENVDYIAASDSSGKVSYFTYTEAGLLSWNTYAQTNTATNLVLLDDITLTLADGVTSNWMPLGNYSTPYTGTIEGNGHTIYNMTIAPENSDYVGMIGWMSGGSIKNLYLANVNVTSNNAYCGSFAGNIAGTLIENCGVKSGTIRQTSTGNVRFAGGIVGQANGGTIVACYNAASIVNRYTSGGIVGYHNSSELNIIGCYNIGSVQVTGENWGYTAGGILGNFNSTTHYIKGCYNTGSVTSAEYDGQIPGAIGGKYSSSYTQSAYNYYSSDHSYGFGQTSGSTSNEGCTKIINTASAWAAAATEMNKALESYGYRYVVNTDTATSSTEPLIIEKITE